MHEIALVIVVGNRLIGAAGLAAVSRSF